MLSDLRGNPLGATPSVSDKPVEIQLTTPYPVGLNFAGNEIPTGTINGINTDFDTAEDPVAGSTAVYINGVLQPLTVGYTLSGNTITFNAGYIPQTGDNLYVFYRY